MGRARAGPKSFGKSAAKTEAGPIAPGIRIITACEIQSSFSGQPQQGTFESICSGHDRATSDGFADRQPELVDCVGIRGNKTDVMQGCAPAITVFVRRHHRVRMHGRMSGRRVLRETEHIGNDSRPHPRQKAARHQGEKLELEQHLRKKARRLFQVADRRRISAQRKLTKTARRRMRANFPGCPTRTVAMLNEVAKRGEGTPMRPTDQ